MNDYNFFSDDVLPAGFDMSDLYEMAVSYSREKGTACPVIALTNDGTYIPEHFWIPKYNKRFIILNTNTPLDDMVCDIRQAIDKDKRECSCIRSNDSLLKFLSIDFEVDVAQCYELAVGVSRMLEIPCPQIFFVRKGIIGNSAGRTRFDLEYSAKGVMVCKSIFSDEQIIYHELRHVWQYKYNLIRAQKKVYTECDDEYLYEPSELDAEAFALMMTGLDRFIPMSHDPKYLSTLMDSAGQLMMAA